MAGYYETQVRRALLTVGDADVLNEMATGWRTSIRDLNTVDDRLARAIRGLKDRDQLGDRTRDSAIDAFRDMRDYIADQRLMLGKTAQALDAAGGALGQVKALVRTWDRAGDPTPPGRPPVADPAQEDQTEYWRLATLHRRQSAAYAAEVQQREDEARDAWQSLNRIFGTAEDKIRSAHGIPRQEEPGPEPKPVYPPPGWPGPEPQPPQPGWPPLPPWPPVDEKPPPDPGPGPGPGPGPLPPGPGLPPAVHPTPHPDPVQPHPGSGSQPGHASAPSHPTTTVGGSAQSGVSYAPGGAAPAAFAPGGAAGSAAAPMAMPALGGAAGAAAATAAGAALRGGAAPGGAPGAARGAGQSGKGAAGGSGGSSGRGGGRTGGRSGGRGVPGGKGTQQGARQAKSERGGGSAGGRGGRRKDKAQAQRDDLLGTDDHWLDDEGTAPDVLR